MPALLDLALAILVLSGALFLGSVGLALLKELTKKPEDKDDQNKSA
jgi:hypothetical protein